MNDGTSRIFGLLAILIGVWVVTYWLYDPSRPAPVTRDERVHEVPAPPPPPVDLPVPPTLPRRDSEPPRAQIDPTSNSNPTSTPTPPPPDLPRGPARVVIPPEFDEYTVKSGDRTLQDVALRIYGDRSKWEAIASANPFFTPDKMRPGRTVLRIPRDPNNIQGRLVEIAPPDDVEQSTGPAPSGPTDAAMPPVREGWRTYAVQENDTLWGIAKKMYGRGSLAGLLADANTDVLPDPDRLRAGITLKVPPAPPAD